MSNKPEIPSPDYMFLDAPLYSSYDIDESNYKAVVCIEYIQGALDTFCKECGQETVFNSATTSPKIGPGVQSRLPESIEELLSAETAWFMQEDESALARDSVKNHALKNRIFEVKFRCARNAAHMLYFYFLVNNSTLMKIGQYPSIADLQSDILKKYRKFLGEQQYREFNRAIGLSAHGIGIGAFVYLRRIFENLIEEAHMKACNSDVWDEAKFNQSRMDEKIVLLRDYLPVFLAEHSSIYSILSKGLHSLTEDECLEFFEPVKLGIELILDEKVEQEEKANKISHTSKQLESIKSKLQK